MQLKGFARLLVLALVVSLTGTRTASAKPAAVMYTWNQTGTASWISPGNWTPARNTPAEDDILNFNGGGQVTVTDIPTQTIGQLLLSNNTTANLESASIATLTISGGAGTDLEVSSGSSLNFTGLEALTLFIGAGATGSISGRMTFIQSSHRLNANDAYAITFNSGAVFTQDDECMGNVFGLSGTASVVVFASGSTFEWKDGGNPFGLNQPNSKVVFQTGSLYLQKQSATPSLSGRTYADYKLDSPGANVSGTGSYPLTMDHIQITNGNITFHNTGGMSIKGSVTVEGTNQIAFEPEESNILTFNGNAEQTVAGTGTITLNPHLNVTIDNTHGVRLHKDLTIDGALALNSGDLNTGSNTLTLVGAATTSGSGDIVGNIKRTEFVLNTVYSFGNPEVSLQFTAGGSLPAEVVLNLQKTQPTGFAFAADRLYSLSASGGSGFQANLRLAYKDSELHLESGASENNLYIFKKEGASHWTRQARSGIDTAANWVETSGVSSFSEWTISGNSPTSVEVGSFRARGKGGPPSALAVIVAMGLTGAGVARLRRGRPVLIRREHRIARLRSPDGRG